MAKPKPKTDEPEFTKAELLDAAHVFGVSREYLAGALHGTEKATRTEVKDLVTAFKDKGVE